MFTLLTLCDSSLLPIGPTVLMRGFGLWLGVMGGAPPTTMWVFGADAIMCK